MAAADCIAEIRAAAGRPLGDDEIEQIVDAIEARRRRRREETRLESVEEDLLDGADELARQAAAAAVIERRNRLINARVFAERTAFAEAAGRVAQDGPAAGIRALNVGSAQRFAGARKSVDARGNALIAEYIGGLVAKLRERGLLRIYVSRQLDQEIAAELWELSLPEGAGRPGASGSDQAKDIAAIIDRVRRVANARENRAGAWKGRVEGFVVSQSHDMTRIRRAGFERWRDAILPRLDPARTFGDRDPEAVLRGAYDGIASGLHIRALGEEETDLQLAFKGPANLARRISAHRSLHFRSAADFMAYNRDFGRGTLTEALLHDLERSARNTALMETWGPNPRAMFDRVLGELRKRHRDELPAYDALGAQALQYQFDEVEGITRVPVHVRSAVITSLALAWEATSKLGGAVLTAVSDLGFKRRVVAQQGGRLLDTYGRSMSTLLEGLAPGDRRVAADLIGVGLDGMIGTIAGRFSAQDDIPGRAAKALALFFKLNLLGPWTDANKRGLGLMWARDLALKAPRAWDALDPETRQYLGLYGLDADRWDVARRAVRREADGREYLMPDAVDEIPDDAVRQALGQPQASARAVRRAKDEIKTGLQSYYVDLADEAIPTPGARERAILRQGTRPGTPIGIAARLVGQFKAFPVTALTKQIGRQAGVDTTGQFFRRPERVSGGQLVEGLVHGRRGRLGLVHLILSTTVLGYLSQSAKEISKGRSPRDPADPETWIAAMLQGGGLGIYGDFLLGETNRFGRSLLDTLAGPTLGTISDIDELRARLMAGDDTAAQAFRLVLRNAPFLNLFYARAPLDYLLFYEIQEALNPGYLRRMERRIQREQGQTFILPPGG